MHQQHKKGILLRTHAVECDVIQPALAARTVVGAQSPPVTTADTLVTFEQIGSMIKAGHPAAVFHSGRSCGLSAPVPRLRSHLRSKPKCLLAGPQYRHASNNPKVALFVEPSPFSHVSGMKIRFSNLIKELRQLGSEVTVFTPCVDPPKSYCGAKVSCMLCAQNNQAHSQTSHTSKNTTAYYSNGTHAQGNSTLYWTAYCTVYTDTAAVKQCLESLT